MTTRRKVREFWTEVKRVIDVDGKPVVKQTVCCCEAPGATPNGCMLVTGNKTPCRCDCHRTRVRRKPA